MVCKNSYPAFRNEPDILTVKDLIRILKLGKNSVYQLLNDGRIKSIKQGRKIIVPKFCLVEFLENETKYSLPQKSSGKNKISLTFEKGCDNVDVARDSIKGNAETKGA